MSDEKFQVHRLHVAMIRARAYARGTASHLSAEDVATLLPLGYQLRERVVELEGALTRLLNCGDDTTAEEGDAARAQARAALAATPTESETP